MEDEVIIWVIEFGFIERSYMKRIRKEEEE